jgi:hypothetical protein
LAEAGQVVFEPKATVDRGDYLQVVGLLRNTTHHEELPLVLLRPKKPVSRAVIWADDAGKAGLFTSAGAALAQPKAEIQRLLDAGVEVVGADLLYQGEFLQDGQPLARTPSVKNPREAAAYTYGYNRAVFAERVDDLLSVIRFVRDQELKSGHLGLAGLNGSGALAAAARALAGSAVDSAAIDTGGFRFGRVLAIHDPNFLPGGAKYGDIPGLLALGAPGRLWLAGEEQGIPPLVQKIYGEAGAAYRVVASTARPSEAPTAAATWLLSNL